MSHHNVLPSLALLLLAACASSTTGEPVRTCLATRDCLVGERCTDGNCTTRAVQACTSDETCGSFSSCVEAVCIGGTACQAAVDCGTGESCDSMVGMCVRADCDAQGRCPNGGACDFVSNQCGPRRACSQHADCLPPNGTCDGGYCTPGCGKLGCATGLACLPATGRCGSGGCASDAACGAPASICEAGQCLAGCAASGCGSGQSCSSLTGRCATAGGCSSDAACGAPTRICVGGQCVVGCGTSGCGNGQSCEASTGRCASTTGCSSDAACGPPTNICEGGRCVAGCGSSGCSPERSCEGATGRCVASAGCSSDAACGAPTNICDGSRCIAGCGASGCSPGQSCQPATGRCETGPVGPADVACSSNTTCSSNYCLTPATAGATNGYCVDPCSAGSNCPAATRCWEPTEAKGLKACLTQNHLAGRTVGDKGPGQRCTLQNGSDSPDACKSGICAGTPPVCAESCSRDADCSMGEHCRAYQIRGTDGFLQACVSDAKTPMASEEYPSRCDDAWMGQLCASWFCAVGVDAQTQQFAASYCFKPCCASVECGAGSVCQPMLPLFAPAGTQSTTLMKGCWPAVPGTGADPVGAACELSNGLNCRTDLCIGNKADGSAVPGYCSDYCCRTADCPGGFACVPTTDAASGYSFNLCAKL